MSHHQQPPRLKITKVIAVFAFVASFEAFIGIEGHDTLGDEHRSETSSEQFFNFIDKDRDGKLGQSELSQFLIAHIGGSTLDEVAEAKKEAEAIRVRLDQNKDDELDSKDIFRYWKSLESLLTVNEVAEWVVHSVQLPPEIGEIFRKNHVTGYDFAELVDNEGAALREELEIANSAFRKKIIRLVNARMLGIGSKPEPPLEAEITLESCSTAFLKWSKAYEHADGFPVHKFRVQRRRLSSDNDQPYSNHSEMMRNEECTADEFSCVYDVNSSLVPDERELCSARETDSANCETSTILSQRYLLEWQDVHDQSETEFHDFGLIRGQRGYQYRIQAWNAVGKSEWVLVELEEWGRKECNRLPSSSVGSSSPTPSFTSLFSWFLFVWKSVKSLSSIVMCFLGVFVTILKYKHIMTVSAASTIDSTLPWLFNSINVFANTMLGIDLIGLIPHNIVSLFSDSENRKVISYDEAVGSVGLNGYATALASLPLHPTGDTSVGDEWAIESNKSNILQEICQQVNEKDCTDPKTKADLNSNSNVCKYTHCHNCKKKYKFPKRKRHQCSRCYLSFCHKCGRTTHNNLVACKVPGNCVCNSCLELETT